MICEIVVVFFIIRDGGILGELGNFRESLLFL